MKQLLLLVMLATTAVFAAAQTPSGTNGKAEQEIRQLADECAKAMLKFDANALAQIMAEDMIISDPNGVVISKGQFLDGARSRNGQSPYEDYHFEELVIHTYGNAAVLNFIVVSKSRTKEANTISSRRRGTSTLIKQKGKWVFASFHSSTIKQP